MDMSVLDRPVWHALETRHARFAEGNGSARRYATGFGLFAAARDDTPASLSALRDLVPDDGNILLLQAGDSPLPEGIVAQLTIPAIQMVAHDLDPLEPEGDIVPLEAADAPQMLALATLAQPGPFFARSHELGQFWGVKHKGQLLAMAGERMQVPGFAEVSGVCSHPDHRGRGYAGLLSRVVATRIRKRGEVPFLHAMTTNTTAIRLYESLGFKTRTNFTATALAKTPTT